MNLKQLYPQPSRVVIRDTFWWLLLGVVLAFVIATLRGDVVLPGGLDREALILKKSALLFAVVIVIAGRITYGILYRATYQYSIHRGRLQIVRGVVVKEEALLPLLPITELYVKRGLIDLLFGLSSVYVAVILERAQRIGEIRGLRHGDAQRVRDEILRVMEQQREPLAAQPSRLNAAQAAS